MVEVPSERLKEKASVDPPRSVSHAKNSDSVQWQTSGVKGVPSGMHEDSTIVGHRLENVSKQQVLPDRVPARTWVQGKAVARRNGPDKAVSRPCDFEKSVNRHKLDISRFEDKFPHRQQAFRDSSRVENQLPLKTSRKDDFLANQPPALEKSTGHSSGSRGTLIIRSTAHERSNQQDDLQRRLHHERSSQEKHAKEQSHYQKTKGNLPETCAKGHIQAHQRPSSLGRDKLPMKSDQGHEHLRNGLIRHQEIGGVEKITASRSKIINCQDNQERKYGTLDNSSPQQTTGSQICKEEGSDLDDLASLVSQWQREYQEPRERVSAHSLRHQPHISESRNAQERPYQRQHLPECLSAHEHETKLIQRQQYLQEKVRSRKMLLGSVIPSDMTFSSEACRNWQSATMLSYRYREEKSYKHMVLSADSGVSMGEGSSASRRNSETETDDQAKDDLPTIIAEMGEIVNRRVPSKCLKCQRNRCEVKDASSQHSHPPSETDSPPSSPFSESISSTKMGSTALDVMSPPPSDRVYQCRVIRDKNTYGTMFYPVYRMYLERDGRPEMLLLTARKRKKCSTSKYLICTGNDELRRKSSSLVGKLRSNLVGTRFHLATYIKGVGLEDRDRRPGSPLKFDSLLLFYETNFLGTKGPRRMKVFLPEVERENDDQLNLLERVRDGTMEGVLTLVNKEPEWDRETLSHILYFEGRVTKSSVKNFQLVQPPDESTVLLQFGKIGRNEFTLDYHPPINAVQAFAIALSSFDGKIACE